VAKPQTNTSYAGFEPTSPTSLGLSPC